MAQSAKRRRRLSDGYSFACFRANAIVRGVFGDPDVRIVRLDRRSKKRFAAGVGGSTTAGTIGGGGEVCVCTAPRVRGIVRSGVGCGLACLSALDKERGCVVCVEKTQHTRTL